MENKNYGKRILHGTGSVWVNDEEIKLGIDYWLFNEDTIVAPKNNSYDNMISEKMPLKIIAQTNLALDGITHIELPEEDVELLAITLCEPKQKEFIGVSESNIESFIAGYKSASKEKKYSEENMIIIRNKIASMMPVGDVTAWDLIKTIADFTKWFDNYIQSLTPKSNDDIVGAELEMTTVYDDNSKSEYKWIPSTHLNKSGQTCFEVKQFIYK